MTRARAVLVTAPTTPIGRRVVERLAADPAIRCVLAVDVETPAPSATATPSDARVRWVQCDLTRYRDAHRLLHETAVELRIDSVVHTPLHRSAADTGRHVWELNVQTTRTLLSLAEEAPGIERFVLRSFADVYRVDRELPAVLDEEHPLDLSPRASQRTRDRIEADMTVCTRIGSSRLRLLVLRCAEVLAPGAGSQLHDYLGSRVCLRSLGYDPVLNLLSVDDAARATELALAADAPDVFGVFNIPGLDLLPLSRVIERAGRTGVAVPGQMLGALYRLRRRAIGAEFEYAPNRARFHFGAVLDGSRARRMLGYAPAVGIDWAALAREPR